MQSKSRVRETPMGLWGNLAKVKRRTAWAGTVESNCAVSRRTSSGAEGETIRETADLQ